MENVGQGADPTALSSQPASKGLASSQTQLVPCSYPCSLPVTAANVTLSTIFLKNHVRSFLSQITEQCPAMLQPICYRNEGDIPDQSHQHIQTYPWRYTQTTANHFLC